MDVKGKTKLTPQEETAFSAWFNKWSKLPKTGAADDPAVDFDWRAAFKANHTPEKTANGSYYWPYTFATNPNSELAERSVSPSPHAKDFEESNWTVGKSGSMTNTPGK